MGEIVARLARFLHVAWLFPMTSSEAASWVQAVGTIAAVAFTGLAVWRSERLARRQRRDDERLTRLELASHVTGWVTARGKELRSSGDSYVYVRAEIKNFGGLPARNVLAWIVSERGDRLTPSRRFQDVVTPHGDTWSMEWCVEEGDPVVTQDFVTLQLEFSLGARRYRFDGDVVSEMASADWHPQRWERGISAAWWFLSNPPAGQDPDDLIAATAVGNTVKDSVKDFVSTLHVSGDGDIGQQLNTMAAAVNNFILRDEERAAKRLLGKIERLMALAASASTSGVTAVPVVPASRAEKQPSSLIK